MQHEQLYELTVVIIAEIPVRATNLNGLEFRCSLNGTGMLRISVRAYRFNCVYIGNGCGLKTVNKMEIIEMETKRIELLILGIRENHQHTSNKFTSDERNLFFCKKESPYSSGEN